MPPFPINPPRPPAPVQPTGHTRKLPDDMDALDAELGTLRGQVLAMSDWTGVWMRPRVVLLVPNGRRPTATLGGAEFQLLGHARGRSYLELTVEGTACGTQGTLRLGFPQQGWRLHAVSRQAATTPAPAPSPPPAHIPGPPCAPQPVPPPLHAARIDAPAPPAGAPSPADAEESARRKRDDVFRRMFS